MKSNKKNLFAKIYATLAKIRNSKEFKIANIILVMLWFVVIFSFSAQPGKKSSGLSGKVSYLLIDAYDTCTHSNYTNAEKEQIRQKIEFPVRKTAHMTEYGMLFCLVFGATKMWEQALKGKKRYIVALVTVFLYASSDEFHQLFVPGRCGEFRDVMVDTTGAIIAMCIVILIKKCISAKRQKYMMKNNELQ